MALVVFLRGVNVGGHRTFRPSVVARSLSSFDVVNVGAAGTFVVRKPQTRTKLRSALRRQLAVETEIAMCDGADVLRLAKQNPFESMTERPDVVHFVSVLARAASARPLLPITLSSEGEWLVRVLGSTGRFVYGAYRRRMKTIGYLGQLDKLFGAPATTRSWSTILSIARILGHAPAASTTRKR
jgi:uncharacterized protein (DUF1697 family)